MPRPLAPLLTCALAVACQSAPTVEVDAHPPTTQAAAPPSADVAESDGAPTAGVPTTGGATTGGATTGGATDGSTRGLAYDSAWEYLRDAYDADHDGAITQAEYDRGAAAFASLDADGDGVVTAADHPEREAPRAMSPEAFATQRARRRAERRRAVTSDGAPGEDGPPDAPAARGKVAPDFTLTPPEGGEPVTLSALHGQPVALIFGSYT